jgi:hypothetical protein
MFQNNFLSSSDKKDDTGMASWLIAVIVVLGALLIIGAGLYFYKMKLLASPPKSKGEEHL